MTRDSIHVLGVIPQIIQTRDLKGVTLLEVIENLVVDVLLGTKIINLCIKGIFPIERKSCTPTIETSLNFSTTANIGYITGSIVS